MDPWAQDQLKQYIQSLPEKEVWVLLSEFFEFQDIRASLVHSTGEHGMDVVAFVDQGKDALGNGYNVIVQAKTGRLSLDKWRNEILYQLLEAPYYDIPHPNYSSSKPRRILLVVTGVATRETRESIAMFNKKHDVPIELWELDDIIRHFDASGFAGLKLAQITGVGQGTAEPVVRPAVGEPDRVQRSDVPYSAVGKAPQ